MSPVYGAHGEWAGDFDPEPPDWAQLQIGIEEHIADMIFDSVRSDETCSELSRKILNYVIHHLTWQQFMDLKRLTIPLK